MQELKTVVDVLSNLGQIDKELPKHITQNLNKEFALRKYQIEALSRFRYYLESYKQRVMPTTLLFQMATGSGKTLVMAAQILYLYHKGYRNFIFFVNSNNIIEKTKNNFLNPTSSKYLFSNKIFFGEKEVRINEVNDFQSANQDDINIIFTTIQGLHYTLNFPKENATTFEDFKNSKTVLLSDEAHHLNALTKRSLNKSEMENLSTWEYTVNRIKQSNSENLLLEFTATLEAAHPAIKEKYQDKLIYEYSLKQFRIDGYSKEVNVLYSDRPVLERVLQALILSQYRRKIAERNGIPLKPVILFKSRIIEESKEFEEEFFNYLKNLTEEQLLIIKDSANGSILERAFNFFETESITLENFVWELKEEFGREKCISVNTEDDSQLKQILVNTLEDSSNPIRAIFAVNMLNEGWDVLNLFDIVRLYNTRDAKGGVPGKTTISEAQLIGRGARYYPFTYRNKDERFKRKFDDDTSNELKVLEDFYYHSETNSRYIEELRKALVETGIMPQRTVEVSVKVKDTFKASEFWDSGSIFVNEKVPNKHKDGATLESIKVNKKYKYALFTGRINQIEIFEDYEQNEEVGKTLEIRLSEIDKRIIRKALSKVPFYNFSNIRNYFPGIKSISEFMNNEGFLRNVILELSGNIEKLSDLSKSQQLDVVTKSLLRLANEIKKVTTDYIGTKSFIPFPVKDIVRDKTLNISIDFSGVQERGRSMMTSAHTDLRIDLSNKAWYIYEDNFGTSEEKYLIKFIYDAMAKLREKYSEVYLLRNEKLFQIYRFSDGSAIEPDFVLFLRESTESKLKSYQLFVEPKGGQIIDDDKWKEEFLEEIECNYKLPASIYEDLNYKIIGLPFFNTNANGKFMKKFEEVTNLKMLYWD